MKKTYLLVFSLVLTVLFSFSTCFANELIDISSFADVIHFSKTYNGEEQYADPIEALEFDYSNTLYDLIDVVGTASATEPGDYSITLSIIDKEHTAWFNNGDVFTDDISFDWSITKYIIPIYSTAQEVLRPYNGAEYELTLSDVYLEPNYDSYYYVGENNLPLCVPEADKLEIVDNKATHAGGYIAIVKVQEDYEDYYELSCGQIDVPFTISPIVQKIYSSPQKVLKMYSPDGIEVYLADIRLNDREGFYEDAWLTDVIYEPNEYLEIVNNTATELGEYEAIIKVKEQYIGDYILYGQFDNTNGIKVQYEVVVYNQWFYLAPQKVLKQYQGGTAVSVSPYEVLFEGDFDIKDLTQFARFPDMLEITLENARDIGEYEATITVKDEYKDYYTISPDPVVVPVEVVAYEQFFYLAPQRILTTYTGSSVDIGVDDIYLGEAPFEVELSRFAKFPDFLQIESGNEVEPGDYEAIIKVKDEFKDYYKIIPSEIIVPYTIDKYEVYVYGVGQRTLKTYTGEEITLTIDDVNIRFPSKEMLSSYFNLVDNTATDVGLHEARFVLKDTVHNKVSSSLYYHFEGPTEFTYRWEIIPKEIHLYGSSQRVLKDFTGDDVELTFDDLPITSYSKEFLQEHFSLSNNVGNRTGNYEATLSLKDPDNYVVYNFLYSNYSEPLEEATILWGIRNGEVIVGDLDGDEEISIVDVRLLLQEFINSASGAQWSDEDLERMDMDGDGEIDIIDVRLLLQEFIDRA